MKIGNPANYYVRVRRESWEQPEAAEAFAGVITVDLNRLLSITFVPDVSAVAPPWSGRTLPEAVEAFTPADARVDAVLGTDWAVTPNAGLAGTAEQVGGDTTVLYVSPEAFQRLAADLAELTGVAGAVQSTVRRDEVADRPAIRFIEENVLTSPLLDPRHAGIVGRVPR